ncbi:MAG TPA: hypothetical protein VL475_12130, partial [Planctomycetaceae bacterium]|nr:hypothetical protein [Planctomycetaceae bacterium]
GKPRTTVVENAILGMRVQKYGRTTGYTKGKIIAINAVVGPIQYTFGSAFFSNQIEIIGDRGDIFATHGDSGSLVVTDDRFPVALLFAGSDITHVVFVSPILPILDEFEMDIDGDDSTDFVLPGKVGSSTAN